MNDKRENKKNYLRGGKQNHNKYKKVFNKNKEKNGYVKSRGKIIEAIGNGMFKILLDNGNTILGILAGKIRLNYIKILVGDEVEVEISVYDLTKGRIIERL